MFIVKKVQEVQYKTQLLEQKNKYSEILCILY